MSRHHFFRTEIIVTVAGVEHDWPATVVYVRYPGYAGSSQEPAEPPSVEIIDIKLGWHVDLVTLPAKLVDKFAEDDALLRLLIEDWQAEKEHAAELRAEALADDRRAGDA